MGMINLAWTNAMVLLYCSDRPRCHFCIRACMTTIVIICFKWICFCLFPFILYRPISPIAPYLLYTSPFQVMLHRNTFLLGRPLRQLSFLCRWSAAWPVASLSLECRPTHTGWYTGPRTMSWDVCNDFAILVYSNIYGHRLCLPPYCCVACERCPTHTGCIHAAINMHLNIVCSIFK